MLSDITAIVLAQAEGGRRERRGRQLPRHARGGADDLDADRLRGDALHPGQGRVPADPGGPRQAPEGDRGGDRGVRARAGRGAEAAARSTASACRRRGSRPRRSSCAPRRAAEEHERESLEAARQQREELLEQTRRDIEAETRRAIQEIRNEVADLTVLATEKVTRKALTAEDQQRLVQEALGELDFAALARQDGEGR